MLSNASVGFLLSQEFSVQSWSSLLPRIASCNQEEIESLVQSLGGSSEHRVDFITPKKKLTPDSSITNLSFSFPLDVFQYITDDSSFKESWPQLRDRILTLSQAVILLGSSFGASSVSTSEEIRGLMVEMGLLQDALGSDDDMTDVPFRSCWEGIRYVHQAVVELTTLTLPLLDTKSNDSRIGLVVDNKVNAIHLRIREIETLIRTIESECLSHFTRLNQLDSFCSGGPGKQTGEAIALHLHNIVARVQRLELSQRESSSPSFSSQLGSVTIPPSSTLVESKLASVSADLVLIRSNLDDLSSRIGQEVIEIGGVQFQSLSQTIAWVRQELPSNAYFVFQDVMTLLDLLGTSNLSDNDFLDGQYKATRANFVNDSAARCAASFGRELPTLFGRVEPSSFNGQLASTHPLPSIHAYKSFNAPDNLSGVKQRIIHKMTTTVSRITAEISQRLAGSLVANSVALNFLLKSQEVILSLVSWMENFQQELSSAGQSSPKEAWLLVCSCVRGYSQQLEKARSPAAASSEDSTAQA